VVRHVIATRYQQDRAMPPGELAAVFRQLGVSTETAPDLAAALARAKDPGAAFRTMIVPQPPIAITGSLFLVGEARTLLLGVPTDPFTVTDPTASQMPGTPK
jgi:folylpolyglutamate synthase/dihydropteroate synthase